MISFLSKYFYEIFSGSRSIIKATVTVVPYLLGFGELNKEVTEQYPDPISSRRPDDLPSKTRGLLFNKIQQCNGCLKCKEVCPVGCINIETEPVPKRISAWISVFDIDFSSCTLCGLCVESCPTGSLVHTKQYELVVFEKNKLLVSFGAGHVTLEQRYKWERIKQLKEDLEE